MEQTDHKEVNQELFSSYVANPAILNQTDSKSLEITLDRYPYCQLLHAFYAKCLHTQNTDQFETQLSKASIYMPERTTLYTIINHPERLQKVISTEPEEKQSNNLEVSAETKDKESESVKLKDVELEPLNEPPTSNYANEEYVIEETVEESMADLDLNQRTLSHPEEEKLILGSIASADFFAFEEKLGIDSKEESATGYQASIAPQTINDSDGRKVSKYDDDKLPYTFLWWLDRTRKEHSEIYQPYVNFRPDVNQDIKRNNINELNSQIIENIFHLQSPLEQLEIAPTTAPFNVKRKEEQIIENFIKEEPQIKAAQPEKLDTENKARKSAEDANDLVSETLASIYIDQMLFHKAIDTYKKLSLKFPEKSVYFADQISELEKKIN